MACLLANLLQSGLGWNVAYNVYPSQDGTRALSVTGVVRSSKDVDVNLPLLFNREPQTSFINGNNGDYFPLYFDHVAYFIPASDAGQRGFSQGIVLQDFAENVNDGAAIGMGIITIGRPHMSIAHTLLATTECTGAIHSCVFENKDGNKPYRISMNNMHHVVTQNMIGKRTEFNVGKDKSLSIDAFEYNSYVVSEEVVISVDRAKLTVWANSTHMELWQQPTALSSLQDLVSMIIMIGGLVAFLDLSQAITQRMGTQYAIKMTDDGFTWVTCVIMADLASSALIIVVLRIYHSQRFVDFRQHGLHVYHEDTQDIMVITLMAVACSVVVYVGAQKKFRWLIKHSTEDWLVLARSSFELAVVLAACACAPQIAGTDFLLAVRFSTGMVINVIIGRDCAFICHKPMRVLSAIALGQALLLLHITATSLVSPVFWLSQSFPNTHVFIAVLSHAVCIVCMCAGAALAPARYAPAVETVVDAAKMAFVNAAYAQPQMKSMSML